MFTQFPHELWDALDSTAEIAILLRILKNVGFAEDGVCFESRESMCNACHVSKDTWRKVIESLEDKEIIRVEKLHNKPYRITLHENYARAKIRTRNRDHIYRDPNLAHAEKRGRHDQGRPQYAEGETFSIVKRRVENFQDVRNRVPSKRSGEETDGD